MNFRTEIETLIRARYPILYIITSEEMRVQNVIVEIAAKRQKKVFEWTFSNGIVPAGASIQSQKSRNASTKAGRGNNDASMSSGANLCPIAMETTGDIN